MKIIDVDNFNRDYETEYLVAENLSKMDAEYCCAIANAYMNPGEDSSRWYRVVPDDYNLYVFEGY